MPQGTFTDTLIRSEAFKRLFVLRPKIDFFHGGPGFFVKNDQNLKSTFFTFYVPGNLGVS